MPCLQSILRPNTPMHFGWQSYLSALPNRLDLPEMRKRLRANHSKLPTLLTTNEEGDAMTDKLRKAAQDVLDAIGDDYELVMSRTTSRAIKALEDALAETPEDMPPTCNPHPDAPHGFNRNASHSEDRYVCECEGWEPETPSVDALIAEIDGLRPVSTARALQKNDGTREYAYLLDEVRAVLDKYRARGGA